MDFKKNSDSDAHYINRYYGVYILLHLHLSGFWLAHVGLFSGLASVDVCLSGRRARITMLRYLRKLRYAALCGLALLPSFGSAQSREQAIVDVSEAAGEIVTMKDMLHRDFGFELPISGSFPDLATRPNPVTIHSSDPAKIIDSMYFVVHGMSLGLSEALASKSASGQPVGVLWRPHPDGWWEYHPTDKVYSFRFERKELTDAEIVNSTIRFYFNISDDYRDNTPALSGSQLPRVRFQDFWLPRVIGWLHYQDEKTVDYAKEHDRPDLGVGLAFGALGIKATIYIYPVPEHFRGDADVLRTEFEQSVDNVEKVTSNIEARPEKSIKHGFFERSWMMGEEAESETALGIAIKKGYFVKYRVTWVRDVELDQAAVEFVNSLRLIVSGP